MLRKKRGISEVVSYVLLISIGIAMAGAIFSWMRFYAEKPLPEESCPEVSIVISDYACNINTNILSLTVQNRGRFNIDSYYVKINNGTAVYLLREIGPVQQDNVRIKPNPPLQPTNVSMNQFDYTKFNRINEIEIEATRGYDKLSRPILCENSIIRQPMPGCT